MELMQQLDAFSSLSHQMRKEMELTLKTERAKTEGLQRQILQAAMKAEEDLKAVHDALQAKEKEMQALRQHVQNAAIQLKSKNAEIAHYKKVVAQLQNSVKEAGKVQVHAVQYEKRAKELEAQLSKANQNSVRMERIEAKIDQVVKGEPLSKLDQAIYESSRTINQLETLTRTIAGQHGEMLARSLEELKKLNQETIQHRNKNEMTAAQTLLQMNSGFKLVEKQVQTIQQNLGQNLSSSLQSSMSQALQGQKSSESLIQALIQQLPAQIQASSQAQIQAVLSQLQPPPARPMPAAERHENMSVASQTEAQPPRAPAPLADPDSRESMRLKRENETLRHSYQKAMDEIKKLRTEFSTLQESSLAEIDRLREREQTLREHVDELFGEPGTGTA